MHIREKHNEITKGHLKKGDVLITNRGEIGNIAIVPDWHVGSNINAQIVRVNSTGTMVVSSYLAYYLQQDNVKQLLLDLQTGSALKQLPINRLVTLPIAIPTKQEQTAIANVLLDSDALIDALEQLIAKKQAIKTAAMQQLLTGRTRLSQFALRPDGTPKGYKSSELGKIPEDWEVLRIAELGQVDPENLGSSTVPDYEFDYVSLEQVSKGTLIGTTKMTFRNAPSRARRVLKRGDVLVSTVRPNLMSHYFVNTEVKDLICSTGFSVVRPCEGDLCPSYLYQHLFSVVINNQIEMLISGSNYPAINSTDVRQLKIQIGSVEEQTAIATILSDMDSELTALEQKLAKARDLKQGMMQQLLTGRIRLPLEVGA
ncbi:restriction endonuclease subunit S [Aeromonas hydrophila]|uniref:restriction endonuclease subunit S n=1 Tax=Aeromonas hydrophila TaxID=644 RepID=UPI003EC58629